MATGMNMSYTFSNGFDQPDSIISAFNVLGLSRDLDIPDSYRGNVATSDIEIDGCFEQPLDTESLFGPSNINAPRQAHVDVSDRISSRSSYYTATSDLNYPSEPSLPPPPQQQQQQQQQSLENQNQFRAQYTHPQQVSEAQGSPHMNHQEQSQLFQQQQQYRQQQQIQQEQHQQPDNLHPRQQWHQQEQQSIQQQQNQPQQQQRHHYQQQEGLFSDSYHNENYSEQEPDNESARIRPKYPAFRQEAVRRATFTSWSARLKPSRIMAQAGFYSTKNGDSVRCFMCGVGLRNWDPEDDPWVEHARWAPQCQYVRQRKGQEFVNLVQAAVRQAELEDALQENAASFESRSQEVTRSDIENDGSHVGNNAGQETSKGTKFSASDRKNPLQTTCAQSVIEMGYRPKVVKKAMDIVIANNGWDSLSGQSIMEEIFKMEESGEINKVEAEIKREEQKPQDEQEQRETSDRSKLIAENEEFKDRTRCKICCENPVSIVFLPCGHLVACAQCAPALRNCAICRKNVKGTVRVCLS